MQYFGELGTKGKEQTYFQVIPNPWESKQPRRLRALEPASLPHPLSFPGLPAAFKTLKPQISLVFCTFFSPLSLLPLPTKEASRVSNALVAGITRKAEQRQLSMACLFWGWNLSTPISGVHRLSHHLTCRAPTITGARRVKNARISFYCRGYYSFLGRFKSTCVNLCHQGQTKWHAES